MLEITSNEIRDRRQRQEQHRDRYSRVSLQVSVGLTALVVSTLFLSSQIVGSGNELSLGYGIAFLISISAALIVVGCASCIHFRIEKWNDSPEPGQLKSLLLSLTNDIQKTVRIISFHEQAIKQNDKLLKWVRGYFIGLIFSSIVSIGFALFAGTILLTAS